jgi:hypothetical protein
MHLKEIKQSIREALDADDTETHELYAVHCAERLNELGETLCLAIKRTDLRAWQSLMAVAAQKAPALADALEAIEEHITRQRATFIEQRAQNLADQAEHEAQQLADLNEEFRRAS